MLKAVEKSSRGRTGLSNISFMINFNNQQRINYADITLKIGVSVYGKLKIECCGSFNNYNQVGIMEVFLSRVNSYNKSECIKNTFSYQNIFFTPYEKVDNKTVKFRVWTGSVESTDKTTIQLITTITNMDHREQLELVSIEYGYEVPIHPVTGMVSGDKCITWPIDNPTSFNQIKETDIRNITCPSENYDYEKKYWKNSSQYIIERQDTCEFYVYTAGLKPGLNKIAFPFEINPIYICNLTLMTYTMTEKPGTISIIDGENWNTSELEFNVSDPGYLQMHLVGHRKCPRFRNPADFATKATPVASIDKKNSKFFNHFSIYSHLLSA